MCSPNLEYQFLNPTTQVALYSVCIDNCASLIRIHWNIYQGSLLDTLTDIVTWTPFIATGFSYNDSFFGEYVLYHYFRCLIDPLQVPIQVVSLRQLICLPQILTSNIGDLKQCISLHRKTVQVH